MQHDLNNIKKQQLELEQLCLSEHAAKSSKSLGRKNPEQPCPIRTEFQRDRDRILHSKAFRRLKHKTQVFLSPLGDHYRTRMTHTLEVSQIARTIARALRLNEDLTEAIALGHDLGHTPFGHSGEYVLNELLDNGFKHNEQSLRVVDSLEPLNLTEETRDGILNHTGFGKPFTMEGQIVKVADRIAYLNHDIDDAERAGLIKENELPEYAVNVLGKGKSERIAFIIKDIIRNSENSIEMSYECDNAMNNVLRNWMFTHIYTDSPAKTEENKARKIIRDLFYFYVEHFHLIKKDSDDKKERLVADYIAGMTDRFAMADYMNKFMPRSWQDITNCNVH
ncbi:MAG: deoxyguanosinetriphosphate triphosphohydrolase [Candidatus Melainabacteria bacterium GWF2_37_15]|nr:MAG: deoxyguanosinetriphosphate triphosphohydrolase [Candidatus Melainabacteria bacterium GWF2_37_15]